MYEAQPAERRGTKDELTRGRAGQRRPSWPPRDQWSCGTPQQPTRQSSAPQPRRELTNVRPPSAREHVVLRTTEYCAAGSRITRVDQIDACPQAHILRIPQRPSAWSDVSFAHSLCPLSRRSGDG